jgi:hypothetical protein
MIFDVGAVGIIVALVITLITVYYTLKTARSLYI